MSELSRARKAAKPGAPTVYCFCDSCERVLYVAPDSQFCPVCSSPVVEVSPKDETISLPEVSDTPSA